MAKDRIILERRFVPKGSIIMRQGDEGYSAYLVQSGRVSVYSNIDGQNIELAQLGMGEICGEMALINEDVRSASVRAIEDSNLIVITRASFDQRMENSDPAIRAMVQMLIKRIQTGNTDILDRKSDLVDLKKSVQTIYDNVRSGFNEKTAQSFDRNVKEKLDALLNAIDDFDA